MQVMGGPATSAGQGPVSESLQPSSRRARQLLSYKLGGTGKGEMYTAGTAGQCAQLEAGLRVWEGSALLQGHALRTGEDGATTTSLGRFGRNQEMVQTC